MIRILLTILFAAAGAAQNPLWIDLSGDWRYARGDAPEYAAPDFDDSGWDRVQLPAGDNFVKLRTNRYWLRRRVQLPPEARNLRLVLNVGTIQAVSEIFVNGRRIGASGDFYSFQHARIARPQSFWIPADLLGEPAGLQIAIRANKGLAPNQNWYLPDNGPWLLTSEEVAPKDAAEKQIQTKRLAY